ncbi:MAG: hypothetical protein A3K76_03365 [Euryarchaeota archaeon RBG_13_57_23]|nr:MAG: hypothetical protein A3K76_03365 [Euryarchaeota archaeon RBG_13_57_23]
METEEVRLLFVVLPAILGLATVAYIGFRVAATWPGFFRALRGWIVVAMVVALALYWIGELFAWIDSSAVEEWKPKGDLGFVVLAAWLAVCMSALGTEYRNLNPANEFKVWFRKHPFNMVSLWGLIGLAGVGLTLAADQYGPKEYDTLWLILPAAIYLAASAAIVLIEHLRRSTGKHTASLRGRGPPKMAPLAISWVLIPTVVLMLGVLGELESFLGEFNPYSWILVVLLGVLARAISKTRFIAMVIDPGLEGVRREGFREYDIPRGAYLVHDEKSDAAFALFSDLTSLPLRPDAIIPGIEVSASDTLLYLIPQGLIITREFPDKVRQKHNLQVTPIIWLTESPGERRIAPTSLSMLTDTIIRFMETNPNSIVFLEGIEYICTFNDFKKVLRFLDALNEAAWVTKARLILTVNPKAFEIRNLALLERDRTVIRGSAGVEDLKVESRIATAPSGPSE